MDPPMDRDCDLRVAMKSDLGAMPDYFLWVFGPIFPFDLYCLSGCFIAYLAATCWLTCDYLDTIRDEVTYVWVGHIDYYYTIEHALIRHQKRSLCFGSFLFFSLRYVGIICLLASFAIAMRPQRLFVAYFCDPPSPSDAIWRPGKEEIEAIIVFLRESSPAIISERSYLLAPALQFPVFWLVEVTMQMRIFALYKSKFLAAVNGTLFVVEVSVMLYLWRDTGSLPVARVEPPLNEDSEMSNLGMGWIWGLTFSDAWPMYWTPAIAFELWLATLAIAKLRRKVMKRELVSVLLTDSLLYFLMIAAFMVLHTVMGAYNLGAYAVPFVIAGETVGGSRLVLHLRKAYYGPREPGSTATHPDISFAMPVQSSGVRSRRVIDESFYDSDN